MRLGIFGFLIIMSVCCASARADDVFPTVAPQDVTALYWENQSWTPSGSAERLTLWRDGRSQITITSHGDRSKAPPLKDGWKEEDGRTAATTYYHKANPLLQSEAKSRFNAALEAGILQLRSFNANYVDGSGTVVGVEIGGKQYLLIIPEFSEAAKKDAPADNQKGSSNEKIFLAVRQAIWPSGTMPLINGL